MRRILRPLCLLLGPAIALRAAETAPPSTNLFLNYVRTQAAALRADDKAPASQEAWEKSRALLRSQLLGAWGGFPKTPAPLAARKLGELPREGYRVEKVVFQTFSNVWMTANAYVPTTPGRHPALLQVHGHWPGAKQDTVVQSRCIGAARLGFFCLAVDAFGAGERGVSKGLGEYHGAMAAATLLPIGRPLSGIQVYENMRAVDYLLSRPEVDSRQIGITGASGGGNQTMYTAAWDERLLAATPVCSVGNYQAYLGAACCLCEVVPGALRFTEEWGVLGLTAPRALMVVSAANDSIQFSPEAAAPSLALAEGVYALRDRTNALRHLVVNSGHAYNQPMREAMYGWMRLHLAGQGNGESVSEPAIQTEPPESLRCYPGDSRPDDWVTLPAFAAAEAREWVARRSAPESLSAWRSNSAATRQALLKKVLGDFPPHSPLALKATKAASGDARSLEFQSEPGVPLRAAQQAPSTNRPTMILLNLDGGAAAGNDPLAQASLAAGWSVITLDLRATGASAWPSDTINEAPDHNTAEWSLWLGRPLLGQWTWDVRRVIDALVSADRRAPSKLAVIGRGPAGVVALCAAALDPRVTHVATLDSLASFITPTPYRGQRLGIFAPGILREVGDIGHLAALAAPRRLIIAAGVLGDGARISGAERGSLYAPATLAYGLMSAAPRLSLLDTTDPAALMAALKDN
ncbi:MAG: acetylxylan esterase [Verrucomicrobia bacterium]|nr:acetylxylan esterase [Verrucomicrobiota bacterium]MBI3867088.1 acetylxylan esterase [Verrucomicrobiota bacterium]